MDQWFEITIDVYISVGEAGASFYGWKSVRLDLTKALGGRILTSLRVRLLASSLVLLFACSSSLCDGAGRVISRDRHAWGRFRVGAWKCVRVTTKNYDERGNVASTNTTETTTTLTAVDQSGYALRVEMVVKFAGRDFPSEPNEIKKGFDGEYLGEQVDLQRLGNENVVIGGEKIPSEVSKVVVNGGKTKRISRVYVSDDVEPYVLKRETTAINTRDNSKAYESQVLVLAAKKPQKILAKNRLTSVIQTVLKRRNRKTVTESVHSPSIPGGVVSQYSTEVDETGRLIRESRMELVSYDLEPRKNDSVSKPPSSTRRNRRLDRKK